MKKSLAIVTLCALLATSIAAQNQRLTSKMVYHNGPVLTGTQNLYLIWYGCWAGNCGSFGDFQTMALLGQFATSIGNTPYAQINSTYTDASGQPAASEGESNSWPGLYFVGIPCGRTVSSEFLHGMAADAPRVARQIARRLSKIPK